MPNTSAIAIRVAEETASLPLDKQNSVLDFVLFVKQQAALIAGEGDAAWERILHDPKPRPRLEAFLTERLAEGSEQMDLERFDKLSAAGGGDRSAL